MTKKKVVDAKKAELIKKLQSKIFYGSFFHGKTLHPSVIMQLIRKNYLLISLVTYKDIGYSTVYTGTRQMEYIIATLKGYTDWDVCGGVNNPFHMGSAKIEL